MTAPNRPDPRQLKRFLLGELPDPEHATVEQFLLESTEPLGADALDAEDALSRLLRSLETPATVSALGALTQPRSPLPPLDLVARLQELLPATTQDSHRLETLSNLPVPTPAGGCPSPYPFLDPPQGPDELGRLGAYRVLRQLGAGGMGIVFAAEDPALRRRVALKVMKPETALNAQARERFLREAQATAQLDHENVVPIYQVGEARTSAGAGVPFIAMPLLAGEALAARLQRDGALPLADVLRLAREAAQGLAAAHAAGLIHRDVKPDNLWLHQRLGEGAQPARIQVKVLDFGLARSLDGDTLLTSPGALLGTPAYMSPEQANGQPVDARSDLFSLGAVVYQMATGRRPFAQAGVASLLNAIVTQQQQPPRELRPDLPPDLAELIDRLLAKDPNRRPQSAADVVATLQVIEAGLPNDCQPAAPARANFAAPRPRRQILLAAALLLAVGGLAIAGWRLVHALRPVVTTGPQPAATVYQGSIDLVAWHTDAAKQTRKLRLNDPGALPLHPGDQFRITVQVQPAGYLYLFWIDTEGAAVPVYPWEPGQWGTRPAQEQPLERLELPPRLSTGYTINGDQAGMETLVLLVRQDPLPADEASLRRDLSGLPAQRPVQNSLAAVWFENGQVVENDPLRTRASFEVKEINDPVLRLQDLLVQKLQPRGQFTSAVSFARLAK